MSNDNIKENENHGLTKTYLKNEQILVNQNLTKSIFKPSNKNKNPLILERLKEISERSENEISYDDIAFNRTYYKDGIEVETDFLDMNESFLIFSFLIKKFEEKNVHKSIKDFDYTIDFTWSEIVSFLKVTGEQARTKNLHKYYLSFERLRLTRLSINNEVSGLINRYRAWPKSTDLKKAKLRKNTKYFAELSKTIIKYIKYNKTITFVDVLQYQSIADQAAQKLFLYLSGKSKENLNSGYLFETLKNYMNYSFIKVIDSKEHIYQECVLLDKDIRVLLKNAISILLAKNLIKGCNCFDDDFNDNNNKYIFYSNDNGDYYKTKNEMIIVNDMLISDFKKFVSRTEKRKIDDNKKAMIIGDYFNEKIKNNELLSKDIVDKLAIEYFEYI